MNFRTKYSAFSIVILTLLWGQVRTPEYQVHDRGNLWETMKDNGMIGPMNPTNTTEFLPGMDWPGGPETLVSKNDQRSYLYGAGIWVGGYYSDGSQFFTEHGPGAVVDYGSFEEIVKVDNFVESPGYDPTEAEQLISAEWTTSENINIVRTSRAWSFVNYNNFITIDYTLTNMNSVAVNDVYIGLAYLLRPSYQDILVHNGWGDNETDRDDDVISYDPGNKMIFSYDSTTQYVWDLGNYWEPYEELRTPGFAGFALLGASIASDGGEQPANVLLAHYELSKTELSLNYRSVANMYAILSGADQSLQVPSGSMVVPFGLMSCGPYDLAPGASITITVVQAVNGLPMEAVFGPDSLIANIQANYLSSGLDSLQASVNNARWLYENNYQFAYCPPPSPPLEVYSNAENQSIVLAWEPLDDTWTNPTLGRNNFKQFNIYRSDNAYIGPFTYVKKIRIHNRIDEGRYFNPDYNVWRYEDKAISLGVGYFYTVTTLDSNGVESWYTNRNITAVKSATLPAENTLSVNVFPNPFRETSGIPTGGEELTITFTNLPATCVLRIYTASGELVKTFKRIDASIGEVEWDQLTDSRQRTAPGIYFWTVSSDVGTAKGTLVLIK